MCVQMPREARRGHCISWNWRVSCAKVGMELGSHGNAASALMAEPCHQPSVYFLLTRKAEGGQLCAADIYLSGILSHHPLTWKRIYTMF